MDNAKIQAKISKLLRLAGNNPSDSESAAAYQAACDLAAKYGLGLDDINDGEETTRTVDDIKDRRIYATQKRCLWRMALLTGIARSRQCKVFTRTSRGWRKDQAGIYAYGQPEDLNAVEYLFNMISNEVDRRGTQYAKGRGQSAGRSYRYGMASEIATRLKETTERVLNEARQTAYAQNGETGLARVNQVALYVEEVKSAVERYEKQTLRIRPAPKVKSVTSDAYTAGRVAGRTVQLNSNLALS